MRREEVEEMLRERGVEYMVDLNRLGPQKHNWVRRGLKVSCEGANHPHHSHFLVDPK